MSNIRTPRRIAAVTYAMRGMCARTHSIPECVVRREGASVRESERRESCARDSSPLQHTRKLLTAFSSVVCMQRLRERSVTVCKLVCASNGVTAGFGR